MRFAEYALGFGSEQLALAADLAEQGQAVALEDLLTDFIASDFGFRNWHASGDELTRPEHLFAYQLFACLTWLREARRGRLQVASATQDPVAEMCAVVGRILRGAPFLWERSLWNAASGLALPEHSVTADLLAFPCMTWTLYGPMLEGFYPGLDSDIDTLCVGIEGDFLRIDALVHLDSILSPGLRQFQIPLGSSMPSQCPEAAWVFALLAVLASEGVPKEARTVNRAVRRQSDRTYPIATWVDIRPKLPRSSSDGEDDLIRRCRWIVRGHLRNQWYPSSGTHRPIYIAPHIKGPPDRPLKKSAYRRKP